MTPLPPPPRRQTPPLHPRPRPRPPLRESRAEESLNTCIQRVQNQLSFLKLILDPNIRKIC